MKMWQIFEEDEKEKALAWIKKVTFTGAENVSYTYKDGMIDIALVQDNAGLADAIIKTKRIEYPIGDVTCDAIAFADLESLDNLPKSASGIYFAKLKVEKIDVKINANTLVSLNSEHLTTLKDIHKFVDAHVLNVSNMDKLEDGLLDILKIKKLVILQINGGSRKTVDALNIIKKYVGKGPKGLVKAQQELIDNDLEDFA